MLCNKNNIIFKQLFIKLAHSFVAIELLTFQKCKIPFLLLKKAFSTWAKKPYILGKNGLIKQKKRS